MKTSNSFPQNTRLIISQKQNCSSSMFDIMNNEFGNSEIMAERASQALAGGVALHGHQCGLLWGSILGVGVEATKRGKDSNHTIGLAIKTSQRLAYSFKQKTNNINCKTIINTDLREVNKMDGFFNETSATTCFKLAEDWAPEAIDISNRSLILEAEQLPTRCRSCATRVIREMGGTEQEALMVAGFAGGLGLSGNLCGALGAAIWYRSLEWLREHPNEETYPLHKAKEQLQKYLSFSDGEFLCPSLSGHRFRTIDQHCDFIAEGGCNKWIDLLATH